VTDTGAITLRELDAIDVGRLRGVGEVKQKALAGVGIDTVLDLISFYPRRWVDRSKEARVSDLQAGEDALVLVTVRSVTKRTTRNRRTMVTATVGDGSGRIRSTRGHHGRGTGGKRHQESTPGPVCRHAVSVTAN